MTLGERVFNYRKKAGISQEELADKLNVTRQSISLWETNQTVPSLNYIIMLADVFGVSIDELCGRDIKEPPTENAFAEKTIDDEKERQCLVCAETQLTPTLIKQIKKLSIRKKIIVNIAVIIISIICIVGLALTNNVSMQYMIILPAVICLLFNIFLARTLIYIKRQSKNFIEKHPNYIYFYSFYKDCFTLKATSDVSRYVIDIKYNEIKETIRDDNYIYVICYEGILPIKISNIEDSFNIISGLLKLQENLSDKNNVSTAKCRPKIKALLIAMFIISILSIFAALLTVSIAVTTSPLPEFPFTMTEYMWLFYLYIPLPLVSAILGIVFVTKKYKCKKNIIAGVIMCILLSIYGSFTFMFKDSVKHDYNYIYYLDSVLPFDLSDKKGYVSYSAGFNGTNCTSMIKFYNQSDIIGLIKSEEDFKSTNNIPANIIGTYNSFTISDYDYFYLYNATYCEPNYFTDDLRSHYILLAYNEKSNIMYILDFIYPK